MNIRWTPWRIFAAAVVALLLGTVFLVIARHPGKYQWDLQTYYYSAKTYAEGKNLYDRDVLSEVAQTPIRFRYVYPPHTLPVMEMLLRLPLREVALLWLAMKGVLICLLFWLWSRVLPDLAEPGYILVALLAYNGAILADVIAGNISLLEQILLWSGFLVLRKNGTASALLIAAASFFKVTYAFFLVLLLLVPGKHRGRAFALGAFFVVVPLVISAVMTPGLFQAFLHTAGGFADPLERGDNNPCLFAFLLTLADVVRQGTGIVIPTEVIASLFILHGIFLLGVSWRCVRRMRETGGSGAVLPLVQLLTLVYPLLVPRFKDYAYILLIPAALSLVMQGEGRGRERWLLMFVLVVPTFTLFNELLPLTEYYLFFASYVFFWWFVKLKVGVGEERSVPIPSQG